MDNLKFSPVFSFYNYFLFILECIFSNLLLFLQPVGSFELLKFPNHTYKCLVTIPFIIILDLYSLQPYTSWFIELTMVNKCSVVGCHTGYRNGPVKPVFQFPRNSSLRVKWIEFLNRQSFIVTQSSRICIDHFDQKFICAHSKRPRLNYSLNPIPTIQPLCIPKSQAVVPKSVRKLPKVRILKHDQLQAFKSKFACNNLTQVINYIHSLDEYKSFLHTLTSRYIALIFNLKLPK